MTAGLIFKKISQVMSDIDAIGKNRDNKAQGFKFRGIDDVMNELHSPLAKHGIFIVPEVLDEKREERSTKTGGVMTYVILKIKYTFFTEDGSSVSATMVGEGSDTGDKASNKAQSVALKYACLQVFAIPTEDDKDPDAHSPEFKSRSSAAGKKPATAAQAGGRTQSRQVPPPAAQPPTNNPVTPPSPQRGRPTTPEADPGSYLIQWGWMAKSEKPTVKQAYEKYGAEALQKTAEFYRSSNRDDHHALVRCIDSFLRSRAAESASAEPEAPPDVSHYEYGPDESWMNDDFPRSEA